MKFAGLCTTPHGGYTVGGLVLSSAAALTATMYAAASCRFYIVTFRSETGAFEEYFSNNQEVVAGRTSLVYKAGVGLFQWLRPFSTTSEEDWSDGTCAGYQESMLDQLSDGMFEASRLFAVLAIIPAWVILGGALSLTCMQYNVLQIGVLVVCATAGTIFAGMTFLLGRSGLCTDEFLETSCELDEGGLVMVAGMLLWLATAVVGGMFLRPIPYGEDRDGNELSAEQKSKLAAEMARQRAESRNRRRQQERATVDASTPKTHKSYSDTESPPQHQHVYSRVALARTPDDGQSQEVMIRPSRPTAAAVRASAIAASRVRSSEPPGRTSSSRRGPRPTRFASEPPRRPQPQSRREQTPKTVDKFIAERLDRIDQLAEV